MWYSRSFADAQDDKKPLGMTMLCTRFADAQDDKKPLGMTMLCTRSFTPSGGSVYGGKERASFRMRQRTANKPDLYLIEI